MPKEKRFFREAYIPFADGEDELAFERDEVRRAKGLWTDGHCVKCIARTIRGDSTDGDLVLVLMIDLLRRGAVGKRDGKGFWGLCPLTCPGYAQEERQEGEAV